jgi:hypothetical protein
MRLIFAIAIGIATTSANDARSQEPYIRVLGATYRSLDQGSPTGPIECNQAALTARFVSLCDWKQTCPFGQILPGPNLCPDPGGHTKRLRVFYTCNWTATQAAGTNPVPGGQELVPVLKEENGLDGESLGLDCKGVLPVPLTTTRINISSTTYGPGGGAQPFKRLRIPW